MVSATPASELAPLPTVPGGPLADPGPASRAFPSFLLPPLPALVPRGEHPTGVRVRVPLSIANVGPGFDHFGLCLEGPNDVLELRRARAPSLEVFGDASTPRDFRRNAATVAAREVFRQSGEPFRVQARLFKGYRGGSGIGSSGASAVAGALAAAALLALDPEEPLTARRVLRGAQRGEAAASGAGHLDNVAASLFGGFVLVEPGPAPAIHRIRPSPEGRIIVALPELRVATRAARSVLPAAVPHEDAVGNVARAASLVLGLVQGDWAQVGRSLEDHLAEPYRRELVPGLEEAKQAALEAGAFGAALSGSGPAVFALGSPRREQAIAKALLGGFARKGVHAETFTSGVGQGASLVGWS